VALFDSLSELLDGIAFEVDDDEEEDEDGEDGEKFGEDEEADEAAAAAASAASMSFLAIDEKIRSTFSPVFALVSKYIISCLSA